jgi:hypothetical protein
VHENPTVLTRQDWRGPQAAWGPDGLGFWLIEAPQDGTYDIAVRFVPRNEPTQAHVEFGSTKLDQEIDPGSQICTFRGVKIPSGRYQIEAWLGAHPEKSGGGVLDVSLNRNDPPRPTQNRD